MSNPGLESIERALHLPGIHYRNPTIPSAIRIAGGVTDGSKIYIAGCVSRDPKRFTFNLQNGETEGSDISLHFDVRFDEHSGNCVVRNSCFGGVWGEEQRESPNFPFEPRKAFIVCITVTNSAFNVELDGNEFITFANKDENISKITHLSLFGTMHISEIHMPFHDNQSRRDLMVSIPGYARIGDELYFGGKTPSDRDRFAINLQTGPSAADNIAYHFNARFKGDDMIVLNHKAENEWGDEIRVNDTEDFKVSNLNDVKLLISIEDESIKAYINGHEMNAFQHRIGVNSIKYSSIESDLLLNNFYYLGYPIKNNKYRVKILKAGRITLPFKADIIQCKGVVVSGIVADSPTRFAVNLQNSNNDIAMHFNPRWDDKRSGGECLVINSKTNGEWGDEIRESHNLKPNFYYEFIFKFEGQNEINVSIDGCDVNRGKISRINHSLNNSDIKEVEVCGSFIAKQISYFY